VLPTLDITTNRLAGCVAIAVTLAALAVTDARHRTLPDALTLGGTALALAWAAVATAPLVSRPWHALAGATLLPVLPIAFASIRRARGRSGGVGWGDVKMTALLGAWFGLFGALAVIGLGGVFGAGYVGVGLLLRRRRRYLVAPLGTVYAAAAFVLLPTWTRLDELVRGMLLP